MYRKRITICGSKGCLNATLEGFYCEECEVKNKLCSETKSMELTPVKADMSMSSKYPKYYKSVKGFTEIDIYTIHKLFNIDDPSGCIQHSSKKLLLSGVRTGGKTKYQDIKEARDTLNRWLELHPEQVE